MPFFKLLKIKGNCRESNQNTDVTLTVTTKTRRYLALNLTKVENNLMKEITKFYFESH